MNWTKHSQIRKLQLTQICSENRKKRGTLPNSFNEVSVS